MDIASYQNASLSINSVLLPGGEQRRRNDSDVLQMRSIFVPNDVVSVLSISPIPCRRKFSKLTTTARAIFTRVLPNTAKYSPVLSVTRSCRTASWFRFPAFWWSDWASTSWICRARWAASSGTTDTSGWPTGCVEFDRIAEMQASLITKVSTARPLRRLRRRKRRWRWGRWTRRRVDASRTLCEALTCWSGIGWDWWDAGGSGGWFRLNRLWRFIILCSGWRLFVTNPFVVWRFCGRRGEMKQEIRLLRLLKWGKENWGES